MEYKIKNKTQLFNNRFIVIEEAEIDIETYDGGMMPISRVGLIRPEVICVLLEKTDSDSFILVEQFRYSALKYSNGWITEIVAGVKDNGESPEDCAYRETLEETGYRVKRLEKMLGYMPSLGVSDQFIHLYFGTVTAADKVSAGGGLNDETEDIRVRELPIEETLSKAHAGAFQDAKTIIALQNYALRRFGQSSE